MAFHVFKLAIEEGVRRVIVTSSNHAADWYETKLLCRQLNTIGPGTYPLSDNWYGWAKASYEHIGFIFATGQFGRAVENAQIRIGAPRPINWDRYNGNGTWYRRDLGAYINERDTVQLYTKSIETADIRNEDEISFQVFFGISNNTRMFWDVANARQVIGYEPEDDAEQEFSEETRSNLTANGRTA